MLSPRTSPDSIRLRTAALSQGWDVRRWTSWQAPPNLPKEGLVLYASPLFAERVSQLLGLTFLEPPDDWLTHLPIELLHRDVRFSTLAEAREIDRRMFFKPAAFKTFPAAVYSSGQELPGEDRADGNNRVLVSEVVHWESEFRFFLLDGRAVTGSVYYRNGESAEDGGNWSCTPEEYEAAKGIAERAFSSNGSELPKSVVVDTGYISGEGWAVIEANPSWGSGLYGSDPSAVLKVLESSVLTAD